MNYFLPDKWRWEPRLEMALMATDGVHCSTCERLHWRPEGLLTVDMNGSGRICPTVAQMLVEDLIAGRPVRIVRARFLEETVSYLEIMPPPNQPEKGIEG